MNYYPTPDNDKEKTVTLKSIHTLDIIADPDFDRLTQLAFLICDTPISHITLLDEQRRRIKQIYGTNVPALPGELSICQYVIEHQSLIEIEDASTNECFRNDPAITHNPDLLFYACYPLIDPNGNALGTFCVMDTKPKKLTALQHNALQLLAEETVSLIVGKRKTDELKNSESFFELSHDLICIAGTDGYFKKINPAFESLLGWDERYLLETPFSMLVHPDDLENTLKEIANLASGVRTINFIHRFRTKKGDYKILQWAATPEPATGNLFAIARDITGTKNKENRLRVSENKFRSFFEFSQGLMCTHDLNGKFLSVNKSGASLLGYTVEEILQKSLFDIVPSNLHQNLHGYLKEIDQNGKSSGLMSTIHKDGSVRIWLYNNTIEMDMDNTRYIIGNSIDITDRMKVENELQKTKEILEQTSQIARVGAWDLLIDKQLLYWSDVTKQIHEVPPDFIPDLATAIHFYKEGASRELITHAVEQAIQNGTAWDFELQIVTAKGNTRWVRAFGKAEMVKGVCKRLYGAFQDIEEQKQTKLALEVSENKYRAFFEISPVGIAINRHNDGKFIDGNAALFNMIGYTEEEYRKLSHCDVTPAKYDEEELKHHHSLTDIGRYGQYEKEYIHKDGHSIPVLLSGIRFTGENGEERVYSVIQDISQRKFAEKALIIEKARLSAFVENAPAAVAMLDNNLQYVAVSNRWLEEYRMEGKNVIGLSHYEVFPNISDEWKEIHARCLKGSVEQKDEDKWRPPGWETDQYLRWEVRPWYLFDGSIGGIMMFTQDITQNCLQREELKAAKIQAEQASLAKSEFLATMSHEIRTPLNGVIGFTDLILKTKLDQTQQQYLNIVNQSANTLLSIINDILDFSKIEAGKLELEIEKCDLYEIGSEVADMIGYQLQKKGLEMLLNISTELPKFIWGDTVRLKQILINLLSNAAKFTDNGEIELKIVPLTDPTQSEITIRFEVRDTGIGIRPEKQKMIFQAFSQEDGTVTRKFGGTGLGLTISNKLLALMNSKLQLESSPGKGSVFYFDLKLATEQGQPSRWDHLGLIKKVLIVDDNANNRTILTQMLLLEQIHADVAKSGIEALHILETGKKYDVILMDYNMPIMDGLETIKKIRQNFYASSAEQPIMLLSSSSDDEMVIKACEDLDVKVRLVKPIRMQDLYRSLSQLVNNKLGREETPADNLLKINQDAIRILIAEDGEVNMLLAKTIIKRIAPNAVIVEAQNGVLAVEACKEELPDIIFMDIQMPEMNGYEATAKIRALQKDIQVPIIAITAGNVKGEREKCIAAGMDDFIAKPIIEKSVSNMFHKWFSIKQKSAVPETILVKEEAETVHINFDKLKEFIGDDSDALKGFLLLIQNEISNSLKDLEAAFAQKDVNAMKKLGHKLKGTSLSANLEKLSGIAINFDQLTVFDEPFISNLLEEARAETAVILQLIKKNI